MMVGGTMCGKTTIVKILQQSLSLVSEFWVWMTVKQLTITGQNMNECILNREKEIEEEKI